MTTAVTKNNQISNRFLKEKRVIQQLTNKDALIDAFISLYNNATKCQRKSFQDSRNKFLQLYKPVCHEINRSKITLQKDFQLLHKDTFVEGAFGKVTIVKSTHDNNIYALKTLNKSYLIDRMDRSSPMEERLVLSNENEEWLPKLYCSFQDSKNLYLVMEYAHGGDLENLMERRQSAFSEEEARFYVAELILAAERIHQLGYIHRDIKPANILIDQLGHIKLGDLGSCTSVDTKDPLLMVGTMPYISPEMCNSEGLDSTKGPAYGTDVDWWSVGIVLYELIHGQTPFTGKDIQIQMSLVNPKISVQFPAPSVTKEAQDLLSRLLHKDKKNRLIDVQQIKQHPFFKDIDWNSLHTKATPPFIPPIKSQDDITFFASSPPHNQDEEEEEEAKQDAIGGEDDDSLDREFPFIGYTYLCSSLANKKSPASTSPSSTTDTQAFLAQFRQNRLTRSTSAEPIDKLQQELNRLKALLDEKDKQQPPVTADSKMEDLNKLKKLHEVEMTQLKASLEEREAEIAKLKDESSRQIEAQKKMHDAEIGKLKALLDDRKSIAENSQNDIIQKSKSRNKTLESKVIELESQIKVLETTNSELETRNKILEADNEISISRNTILESDKKHLESRIEFLESVSEDQKLGITNLTSDNKELESRIMGLAGKKDELENRVTSLKHKNNELKVKNKELESSINYLANEKNDLKSSIENLINNKATADDTIKQQLLDHQQTILSLKKEIESYRSNKSLLEEKRIPQLEKENGGLNTKLLHLENQVLILTNKLKAQSTDYTLLLQQSKSECAELKAELVKLQVQPSNSNSRIRRSNKSLPNIPSTTSLPNLGPEYSPGEGRSLILSSMWQRDRESLKSVQEALEESESKLAFAKRQVIRLKKEVKCFQKYTFEQQHDKNSTGAGFIVNNAMDNGSTIKRITPPTPPQQPFSPSFEAFDQEVALLDKKLATSARKTNKVDVMNFKKSSLIVQSTNIDVDTAIIEEIKREQNFINSTKRTIAARSRLSRTKGEIDQELGRSLELSNKRLNMLESKVVSSNKKSAFSSPKDYPTTNITTSNSAAV